MVFYYFLFYTWFFLSLVLHLIFCFLILCQVFLPGAGEVLAWYGMGMYLFPHSQHHAFGLWIGSDISGEVKQLLHPSARLFQNGFTAHVFAVGQAHKTNTRMQLLKRLRSLRPSSQSFFVCMHKKLYILQEVVHFVSCLVKHWSKTFSLLNLRFAISLIV